MRIIISQSKNITSCHLNRFRPTTKGFDRYHEKVIRSYLISFALKNPPAKISIATKKMQSYKRTIMIS